MTTPPPHDALASALALDTARPVRERVPSFWTLQLAGWAAFGVAMASSRIGIYPVGYMVAAKLLLATLGLVTSLGLRRVYQRMVARRVGVAETIVVCVVLSYLAASLWTLCFNLIDPFIQAAMLAHPDRRSSGLFGLFVGSVYHAFALFGWSVLYFGIKHYEALQVERERALRAESLAHAAQLQALRYQLNPHFLFNTLNAISTLVVDGRSADAARMLSRLSDFLRVTLDADASEQSLTEEIDLARRYLEIEQVRFGDRLQVLFDIEGDAWQAAVPAFLLQPLVENAIQHGVARREDGGTIHVSAERTGGTLSLSVANDGPALAAHATGDGVRGNGNGRANGSGRGNGRGRGIGLANTRARLEQLYGTGQRFAVSDRPGGGVIARIELPFRASTPE